MALFAHNFLNPLNTEGDEVDSSDEDEEEQEIIRRAEKNKMLASAVITTSIATGIGVHGVPKHISCLEKEKRLQMMKLVAEEIDVAEI